jgi:hypothetical protein
MKKYVVLASALALAACGSNEAEVAETEIASGQSTEEVSEAGTASPLVGSYAGESEDGEAWVSTLNADGTYQDVVAGEVSETGKWTHEGDQLCFNPDAEEGTVSEQTCLTLVNVNPDGSLLMADAEGNEMTVPRLAE